MLKFRENTLWLENAGNLFCNFNIIPLEGMNLAEQMNSITRLIIVIFIILILFGFQHSLLFLLLSMLFIIILYYIQKNNMNTNKTEHFSSQEYGFSNKKLHKSDNRDGVFNITSCRFCNDERPLDEGVFNNPNWVSDNKKLVGTANPKTTIPPVIVSPIADLNYWKANNLVTNSAINEESNIDVYQSGYQVSTCCAPTYDCAETCRNANPKTNSINQQKVPLSKENYNNNEIYNQYSVLGPPKPPGYNSFGSGGVGSIDDSSYQNTGYPYNQKSKLENFELPYLKNSTEKEIITRPSESGEINIMCGYNPRQLQQSGLPTNFPAGNCQQKPEMKQFNENLFTQTIQPGVYTRNEITEPINSNIGISFTQQNPPTTCKTDLVTGEVEYIKHDPCIIEPIIETDIEHNKDQKHYTEANVYDPRFYGYGTSYRSYTDENVGQTRFYYDDVDAIRMPNYITRSNIDSQSFADSYGPIPSGNSQGNKYNSNIRALANDAFMTSTIQHRTDLQERLMRKANNRQWQLRQAPLRSSAGFMLGGMSSK